MEANLNKTELHYHSSGGSFWDSIASVFGRRKKLTKDSLRILFIDDNKFPIIDNLAKAGYVVNWIKDIKNQDDPKVIDSHIIFVDYKGIGKNLSPNKEGIGVCKILRDKYKDTKYIVLLTGESVPHELIQEIKSASHENMSKNSQTDDLIRVIDEAVKKIKL